MQYRNILSTLVLSILALWSSSTLQGAEGKDITELDLSGNFSVTSSAAGAVRKDPHYSDISVIIADPKRGGVQVVLFIFPNDITNPFAKTVGVRNPQLLSGNIAVTNANGVATFRLLSGNYAVDLKATVAVNKGKPRDVMIPIKNPACSMELVGATYLKTFSKNSLKVNLTHEGKPVPSHPLTPVVVSATFGSATTKDPKILSKLTAALNSRRLTTDAGVAEWDFSLVASRDNTLSGFPDQIEIGVDDNTVLGSPADGSALRYPTKVFSVARAEAKVGVPTIGNPEPDRIEVGVKADIQVTLNINAQDTAAGAKDSWQVSKVVIEGKTQIGGPLAGLKPVTIDVNKPIGTKGDAISIKDWIPDSAWLAPINNTNKYTVTVTLTRMGTNVILTTSDQFVVVRSGLHIIVPSSWTKMVYSEEDDKVATVKLVAAWEGPKPAAVKKYRWTFTVVPQKSVLEWTTDLQGKNGWASANYNGLNVYAKLTGLPDTYKELGIKVVKIEALDGADGVIDLDEVTALIGLYYTHDKKDNPGGKDANWFFYNLQITADLAKGIFDNDPIALPKVSDALKKTIYTDQKHASANAVTETTLQSVNRVITVVSEDIRFFSNMGTGPLVVSNWPSHVTEPATQNERKEFRSVMFVYVWCHEFGHYIGSRIVSSGGYPGLDEGTANSADPDGDFVNDLFESTQAARNFGFSTTENNGALTESWEHDDPRTNKDGRGIADIFSDLVWQNAVTQKAIKQSDWAEDGAQSLGPIE